MTDPRRCPRCAAPRGQLSVSLRLVAKPLGSFSLAGVTPKVSACEVPVLECAACGLELAGEVQDGYAVFPSRVSPDEPDATSAPA